MAVDSGLWFVNGKVVSNDERVAVWKQWENEHSKLIDEKLAMQERHRQEEQQFQWKYEDFLRTQPCTPWVGRTSEGADPAMVERAQKLVVELQQRVAMAGR